MTNKEIIGVAVRQLAVDLNCTPENIRGEGFVFVPSAENPGRRPFSRADEHFEMITMGASVVVSATPALLDYARREFEGKTRDEAFSAPFIGGLSLYYLPDMGAFAALPPPGGFEYEWVERGGFAGLYKAKGFNYAIQYDLNHPRPDALALVARCGGQIAGVAGASADCESMWQIGIDVLPAFRSRGLAAYLSNALAREVLRRGIVPYYGTSCSNVASQRVAHRAGFAPGWMCVYTIRGFNTNPTC